MKTLIKKSFVFVLLITTLLTHANKIDTVRVFNNNKITLLILPDVLEGNLLTIKDLDGVILYQEEILDSGNYIKRFNLTTLPDGAYYFELNKGIEVRMIPFSLKSNIVTLNKAMETVIHKPLMNTKENLVYIKKSDSKKKDFQVEIYYNENNNYNLIHTENITQDDKIRVYKLDKKERGNYKIVYTVDNYTFTDYFKI